MKRLLITGSLLAANAFAITGGPNMPEYTQFEEVSASNLVDLNSGSLTYTIPLMEVPGPGGTYPLALAYHSGIHYNQEASWVGLGWSLNAGAINRELRGVPDDYFNSVVATRNVLHASGRTINVDIGVGNFGLAMDWNANTGEFMGATPYLTLGLGLANIPGLGNIGLNATLTPGGASVGVGAGLPIGTVSLGLYDTQNNSAGGNLGFKPGIAGFSISHSSGVGVGTAPGQGSYSFTSDGISIPLGKVSLSISEICWRYTLDETIFDYMNGYLFQNGKADQLNFDPKVTATAYLEGKGTGPRQRFERSKFGTGLYPSADVYQISANGISGSFEPFIEPGAAPPVIDDGGGANNEGYLIENAPSFNQITFRMDGDPGYNLIQGGDLASTEQIGPDSSVSKLGNKRKQYGSYRIMPVFNKMPAGTYSNILVGFSVTNTDGVTYEYLMPVYNQLQADYSFKDQTKATLDRMEKVNAEKYATSWLLTAVKGADYIAQNASLTAPQPGDYGHWVRFNYTAPTIAAWSAPFTGNLPSETNNTGYYDRSFGIRDQIYLASVETETHRADFDLVDRVDVPVTQNGPVRSGADAKTEMTYDDGLVASSFSTTPGQGASLPASGGFPVRYAGLLTDNVYEPATGVVFKFPGDWGNQIKAYRAAKCGGNQCSGERIIGFNVDWLYKRQSVTGDDFLHGDQTMAFTGLTTFHQTYDNGISIHNQAYNFTANCNNITVQNGFTQISCDMNWGGDQTSYLDIKSVFLNWPWLFSQMQAAGLPTFSQPKALAGIRLTHKATGALTKEIRFGYDYSLCNNIPSHPGISASATKFGSDVFLSTDDVNNKGKLTLKRLSVYGVGGKAAGSAVKLPDYNFTYQSGAGNPAYSGMYNLDEWGMYSAASSSGDHRTRQDQGDAVGVCWNLQKISLPTGGSVNASYQRDHYYFAGMAKDTVLSSTNNLAYFAMPDIYNLDLPKMTFNAFNAPNQTKYDWSKFYQLGSSTTLVGVKYSTIYTDVPQVTLKNCPLPKSETASDGKIDDYPITTANTSAYDLGSGDMVMVVYVIDQNTGADKTPTWTPKLTGVLNFAIVTRSDASGLKRVKLRPLFNMDANKKFFYFPDFAVTSSGSITSNEAYYGNYRWHYYLVPIRNAEKKFYGGGVAVKTLQLDDGFGNLITKSYDYTGYRKDASGNQIDNSAYSTGATWSLPAAYPKDMVTRYWEPQQDSNKLRFDPWPTFQQPGTLDHPTTWTDNYMTRFLNNTYKAENLPGGYYYPQPNVSFARGTEKTVDGSNVLAGYTEYQFFNLSHQFLNMGPAFSSSNPISVFMLGTDDWLMTGSVLQADLVGLNGKLIKKRDLSSAGKIARATEYYYGEKETIYTGATTSDTKFLGAVSQKTGYKISPAASASYVSVFFRNPLTGSVVDVTDGVPVRSYNEAYDSKSGNCLVTQRRNGDGNGVWTYRIPLHWSNTTALAKNELGLDAEERVYNLYASDEVIPRADLTRVLKATANKWSTVSIQKDMATKMTSPYLYKVGSYEWSRPVGWQDYAVPDAAFSSPWRPAQDKVNLINAFGYPLEKFNEATGLYTAEFTGYGSNLVVGTVSGAKWTCSSVYTGDYDVTGNSGLNLDKVNGWVRNAVGQVLVNGEAPHFGKMSTKLLAGASISNTKLLVNPSQKKITMEAAVKAISGSIRVEVQPVNGSANVGVSKYVDATSTGWTNVKFEIDLTQSQYASATGLFVRVWAMGSASGYVDDVRVYPSDALAKSYYYDPATLKLIAVVDENKYAKTFNYDARGRVTSMKNALGQTVSTATYKDFQ